MEDKQSGSPPDTQGSAPKKKDGPELKSPREWALITGNGPKAKPGVLWTGNGLAGMSRPMGSVEHEVASVLHGWREHEHHANEPMLLTLEDYLAALKASHPQEGNPIPHPAALSPHKGGRIRVRLANGKTVTEVEKSE